ncbi:hypothetical protein [Paenibacillus sp. 1P03SA]|uniref:hypothetical protein n=1 Tax=Paenibacillus sp. 1P03SA TaxID=3132294 RepID=UPI0039A0CEB3
MKKWLLLVMACMLTFSVTMPGTVEAKKSYSSTKKSYTPSTTNKSNDTGVNKSTPSNSSKTTSTAPTQKRGFFSGGLMKGLLIGGLAGMLFGGLFGGMGMLGNVLGFMVNMLAILLVVMVIRRIVVYFMDKRKADKLKEKHNLT